jgi:amino acid adenylation domain-containing protein
MIASSMENESFLAPLSFAQQRLWFLNQLAPDSPFYNIFVSQPVRGKINLPALQHSLNEIVRRHETLRTSFAVVDGQPMQLIAPSLTLDLPLLDLRHLSQPQRQAEALRLATLQAQQPFDLSRAPLLRALLLQMADEQAFLLLTMHHIVSDGWSMGIFAQELTSLYSAFVAGRPSPLGELPIQYADFALWQREWLQGGVLAAQLDYWKGQLGGISTLQLPTDHPRPAVESFRGAHQPLHLSEQLTRGLKRVGQEEGGTLFMVLLAAYQVLLKRYSGQDDIVVGSPIANRTRSEVEGLIGFFVNTLVLRGDLSGDPSFRELLRRVREVALGAYEHQDLPFEKLVEELHPQRDLSRNPLFQVGIQLYQSAVGAVQTQWAGSDVMRALGANTGTAKFDLLLSISDRAQGPRGDLEYSTDLFDPETIERMARHLETLLEGVALNPDLRLSQLPMLTPIERDHLINGLNVAGAPYPRERCVHELVAAFAATTPEATAVIWQGQSLTYSELNERANQLARYIQLLGVGREAIVGVYLQRSADLIVSLLAVLKAGAAYLPLDPTYPDERLAYMIADTNCSVIITQRDLAYALPTSTAKCVCIDTEWPEIARQSTLNPSVKASPENLAYVMYTSGSTGRPKGVTILHRGIVRLADSVAVGPDDTMLHMASNTFDAATFEIWVALLNGARLAILPSGPFSLEDLGRLIHDDQVTTALLTPVVFHQMVERNIDGLRPLKTLLVGGDVVSPWHIGQALNYLEGCTIINAYGPTENTTLVSCYPMTDPSLVGSPVPIGRPVPHTQVYILDSYLQPVPIGVVGELYAAGDGLARGYLNAPDLTAQKFIPDPFGTEAGGRLYRTGDLARYLADGNIEFLGRVDQQVKIRGYRVEPGEVEAVLAQHPAVREAVVLARDDPQGDKRLVAYVVPDTRQSVDELRLYLSTKLPGYMIPSRFEQVTELPVTPSGKIDRRALLAAEPLMAEQVIPGQAPRNDVEEALADIWAQVLGQHQPGVFDNFFDLGGHSLLATQVVSRVRQTFAVEVPMRSFFETPTIAALATLIETILIQQIEALSEEEAERLVAGEL